MGEDILGNAFQSQAGDTAGSKNDTVTEGLETHEDMTVYFHQKVAAPSPAGFARDYYVFSE